MADSVFGFFVFVVVGILLFLRARGAAIRKKEEGVDDKPEEAVAQPISSFERSGFLVRVFAMALGVLGVLAIVPGLIGVWLFIDACVSWLQTAEWKPLAVSAYIDPVIVRSQSLAGWNKLVDWLFSRPAWVVLIISGAVLYAGMMAWIIALQDRDF